ncbi:MAG: hypothetical protein K2X39_04145 [Silvanigrellaceae bacterium]|nr:hypothetical protein [Silvanigrellaceae bacterium]
MKKLNSASKLTHFFLPTIFFTSLILITGCSSTPKMTSTVVANIDGSLVTPEWANGSVVILEENENIIYVNTVTLNEGNTRPDACLAIARTNAVAEMMKYIKQSVTSSGQAEDLNASSDPSFSSLTAYLSQGNISGTKILSQYWEIRMQQNDNSKVPYKKQLRCAVKVGIARTTLENQMRQALHGAPGGNPEIREKLIEKQKEFLDSVGSEKAKENSMPDLKNEQNIEEKNIKN